MGSVTYTLTPACKHGRHGECGSVRHVINAGVCCTCGCHPTGSKDDRPLREGG